MSRCALYVCTICMQYTNTHYTWAIVEHTYNTRLQSGLGMGYGEFWLTFHTQFWYRGSIKYRDMWDSIVIVVAISGIAQHQSLTSAFTADSSNAQKILIVQQARLSNGRANSFTHRHFHTIRQSQLAFWIRTSHSTTFTTSNKHCYYKTTHNTWDHSTQQTLTFVFICIIHAYLLTLILIPYWHLHTYMFLMAFFHINLQ